MLSGLKQHVNYFVEITGNKPDKILVQLKQQYGKELDWLLPYMGDWHLLLNYGKTLMKIYKDAGLEELVCKYHKGATAAIVIEGNSFEKTLNFFLECWETLYRYQIGKFLEMHTRNHPEMADSDLMLFETNNTESS